VRLFVAWRVLTHERGRTILAVLGVFAAIVLVFLQLGFYGSVPVGSTLIYDALKFDIALTSRDYTFQVRPHWFPRRRLNQALALPAVEAAVPFHQGFGRWLNTEAGLQREVFVMGFDVDEDVIASPSLAAQVPRLKRADSVLVDSGTKSVFGDTAPGTPIEINGRQVTVAGGYDLGVGFLGLGAVTVSDATFTRLFPNRSLDEVQVGLIRLKPGTDVMQAVADLRAVLPEDTAVLTRAAFLRSEQDYWLRATSTGIVFGFGAAIAAVVGGAILFQTLGSLILRNLPEYAVLKALGYGDRYLSGIVVAQAALIVLTAAGPAVIAAYALYDVTRMATSLPVYMTGTRIITVVTGALAVAAAGAALTSRILTRADPADLF
jgi:putative ABC transport system permease protein